MWHEDILGTIGHTPLVRIQKIGADLPCTVLAKLELFNPGASVKDRIGVAMVRAAEKDGRLKPGGTIIECTSGNTGTGLALAGIAGGYRCIFTTTDKQSQEKIDVLRGLGAEVIVCPTNVPAEDPRSYYSVAARLAQEIPDSFHANQYDNPANEQAHYETTGPELWEQTDGRITHFIAGAGTGGTISGTSRYLKEQRPDVRVVGVDPMGSVYYKYYHDRIFDEQEIYPYLTEGVGEDILAGNMNFSLVDDYVRVTDKHSMQMTRRLAREEGMFIGQSCGMAMAGALQWMRDHRGNLSEDDVVVILFPDSGFRYLSKTYDDGWMKGHGFLEIEPTISVARLLAGRQANGHLLSVGPNETLGVAIDQMAEAGVSQVPVVEEGAFVGTLTESGILNYLIQHREGRGHLVVEVMADPMPLVSPDLDITELSQYLDAPPGAVLVTREGGGHAILTKTDLISALARVGRARSTQ